MSFSNMVTWLPQDGDYKKVGSSLLTPRHCCSCCCCRCCCCCCWIVLDVVSYIFQAIIGNIVLPVKDPRNCNLHFWGWCAGFKEVRKSLEGKNVILQFHLALLLSAALP